MRNTTAFVIALLVLAASASAAGQSEDSFHWDPWRHLPVQDGGRYKPLDTLAWETLRTLCNRASMADPETGQKLNSTALYLAMLFDWQAPDQPPNPHMAHGKGSHTGYFAHRQPDKWDRAPLLRVDFLALREALGMESDQKYISPLELEQAKIRIPHSAKQMPFVAWAEGLVGKQSQGVTTFEQKALELADKSWSYQQHRMGERLQVVPVPGGEGEERRGSVALI